MHARREEIGPGIRRLVGATVVVAAGSIVLTASVAPGHSALDLVPVVLLVAGFVFATLSARNAGSAAPTRFVLRGGAFAVPATRSFGYLALAQLMLVAFAAQRLVDRWAHPHPGLPDRVLTGPGRRGHRADGRRRGVVARPGTAEAKPGPRRLCLGPDQAFPALSVAA